MWTTLLLILSLAASSLGNSVPLVVYKRPNVGSTTVYQFKLNTYAQSSPSDGYEMINGENKEGREFTYVRVYPYLTYEGPQGTRNFDSFDRKLSVCRMDYDTHRGRVSTHLLSGIGCNRRAIPREANINRQLKSISDTNQDFYVSPGRPNRVLGTRVTLTQCLQQSGQLFFTSLVEGNAACPPGSRGTYSESFWVVAHNGIACPDIKEYNGLVRSRDMVDGVFPSRVTMECNIGYQVEGRSEVTCNSGRWSDDLGTCEKKSCGSPGDLIYGELILEGESYGDMARYRCDDGYILIGNPTRLCTKEGTWTGRTPTCDRITCEPLQQPINGQHNGSSTSNFASGSVVAFKCNEGYKIDGAENLRCELDATGEKAQWSNPAPLCNVCTNPGVPDNGKREGDNFNAYSTVTFSCDHGYELTPSDSVTIICLPDSGWNKPSPICEPKSCNNPGVPDNGKREGDNFFANATVTFSCDNGYTLTPSDSASIVCLPNHRWNKRRPLCELIKCPTLTHPENGLLGPQLFQYGQNITFRCLSGYQLQGNPQISCQANGLWDRDMPHCTPCPRNYYKSGINQDTCKSCPAGSITLTTATTHIHHCMCEEGSSRQQDGTCVAIRCETLAAPENGSLSECESTGGSRCTFSCDPGFILSGSRERRCRESGWTGNQTKCTACPENSYQAAPGSQTCYRCPVNTHTDGMIGISLNSCVCKEGYTRASGAVGRCYDINECLGDNGGCEDRCANTQGGYYCQCTTPGYALSEDGKTCYKKNCGFPEGLIHGSMSMNGKYVGDVATYECGEGYKLIGNQMRVCAEDGTWTGSTPVCQSAAINCKAPAVTENVEIYYSFGEAINFKCKDGFHLQGSPKATCTANGWDNEPPSCSGN